MRGCCEGRFRLFRGDGGFTSWSGQYSTILRLETTKNSGCSIWTTLTLRGRGLATTRLSRRERIPPILSTAAASRRSSWGTSLRPFLILSARLPPIRTTTSSALKDCWLMPTRRLGKQKKPRSSFSRLRRFPRVRRLTTTTLFSCWRRGALTRLESGLRKFSTKGQPCRDTSGGASGSGFAKRMRCWRDCGCRQTGAEPRVVRGVLYAALKRRSSTVLQAYRQN